MHVLGIWDLTTDKYFVGPKVNGGIRQMIQDLEGSIGFGLSSRFY